MSPHLFEQSLPESIVQTCERDGLIEIEFFSSSTLKWGEEICKPHSVPTIYRLASRTNSESPFIFLLYKQRRLIDKISRCLEVILKNTTVVFDNFSNLNIRGW